MNEELISALQELCDRAESACDENVFAGCTDFFPEQSPELFAAVQKAKEVLAKARNA